MANSVQVPNEVLSLLMLREGWRTKVYRDTAPGANPTCGMGHLLTPAETDLYPVNSTVPDDVLQEWQDEDTEKAYIAALSQARQIGVTDQRLINALACVSFQLGAFWRSRFPKTWDYLLAHEWDVAASEAAKSKWFEETPERVKDFQAALLSLDPPSNNGVDHGNPAAI